MDLVRQLRDGLVVRPLLRSDGQRLLHAGLLLELILVLRRRVGGVHAAGGADGVAAHHGLLLQQDDTLPGIRGGDGGHHSRSAGPDDGDVRLKRLVRGLLDNSGGLVLRRVHARSHQGGLCSLQDARGAEGGSAHPVHRDGVAPDHGLRHPLDRHGTDALGLPGPLSGDLGDDAILQRDGHADRVLPAKAVAGPRARDGLGTCLHARHDEGEDDDGKSSKDDPFRVLHSAIPPFGI